MMFAYSFLAMTAYNILKPITRSKFIADLGPDNLPYVLLAAGVLIGILMTGYSWLMARLPERGALPITQAGMAAVLFGFWFLFQTQRVLGLRRVLSDGAAPRRAPDQPVLDAREPGVRPAAGQAALRIHRRRRTARRHRGLGDPQVVHDANRHDEHAADQRHVSC